MSHPDLVQYQHKKMYRLLKKGWIDRTTLAEEMFMSESQISALVSVLRNKRINIEARPHAEKKRFKEYRLGDENVLQTRKCSNTTNELLIMEMNHIRLEAEKNILQNRGCPALIEIKEISERALRGCGLITESTVLD